MFILFMAIGFLAIVSIVSAKVLYNWLESCSVIYSKSASAEDEAANSTSENAEAGVPNAVSPVDFENLLRKFLLLAISVAKWVCYFMLSLLVLLIFIPKLLNYSGDDLWYILACIGLVAVYPVCSICKHWSLICKGWSYVGDKIAKFRRWLHNEPGKQK